MVAAGRWEMWRKRSVIKESEFKTEGQQKRKKEREEKRMESSGNGFVKIGELDRRIFMLLLQQKFLTFDLLLKWFEP